MTRPASRPTGVATTLEQASTEPPGRPRALDDTVARALRGLFGRDSLYMVIWAIQLVGAALLTPVITRVMGTGEFGSVAAANAVMQVLFVLAGLGLSTAIQRQYAGSDGPAHARRLLTLALVTALVITVLADATGSLWSAYLGFESYEGAVRLAVLWAGASAVTNSALALLRSKDRLLAFSCVSLLQSVVAEGASLALVATVRPTATMFLLGQLMMQLLALGLALLYVPPLLLRRSDKGLARAALIYGLPLVPALLSTFVLASVDRFIIQDQLGAVEVARYQVAYNIGAMPLLLIGVLNAAWLPRIFALDEKRERAEVLAASRDALYSLLIPVVVGLSVASPLLLRIWAPAEYRPDDLLLVTACVIAAVLPYTAGITASRALLAHGETRWMASATLIAAVVNVALNVVLVPLHGLLGSALATFLAYCLLQRLLVTRAQSVAPIKRTPATRVLGLVGAGLAALIAAAMPTNEMFLALRSVAVLACLAWFTSRLLSITTTGKFPQRPTRRFVSNRPALAVTQIQKGPR
jgi:O-antigen/teichoic acid export membrane protein